MKHVLRKVKDGKVNDWRAWCAYLCAHEVEAKATMRYENCVHERCVLFTSEGEWYVVGSMAFVGESKGADMNVELNVQHRQALADCLGKTIAVFEGEFLLPREHEVLYDFIV